MQAEAAKIKGFSSIQNSVSSTPRCERCWSGCLDCLRPSSAYACTSCIEKTFLVPLVTPKGSQLNDSVVALMGDRVSTKPVIVGSCLGVCPEGYVANEAKQICEQYVVHLSCKHQQLPLCFLTNNPCSSFDSVPLVTATSGKKLANFFSCIVCIT